MIRGRLPLNDCRIMVETDRASRICVPIAVSHQSGIIKWHIEYHVPRTELMTGYKLIMPSGRWFPRRGPAFRSPVPIKRDDKITLVYSVHYAEEHASRLSDEELARFIEEAYSDCSGD